MKVKAFPSTAAPATFELQDTELLQAWVCHQRQADFTEIVRRHLGLVRGIARRQVGNDLADDVAQMVFAILARKASGLTEVRSLGSWLHRVTVLQCRGMVRGQIRTRRSQQSAQEIARLADARDPLAEVLPVLDSAICDLPDSDRELIHLRYSHRLTFPEVARRTGRSEAALRQQAGRALGKLEALLQRRGVAVPAATLGAGIGVTLTGTAPASAASSVSAAAIASAAIGRNSWIPWVTLFTMSMKKSIFAVVVMVALVAVLGVLKSRENGGVDDAVAGPSAGLPRSGSSLSEPEATPEKTKTTRSRAVIPPSSEEVEDALNAKARQVRAVNYARQIGLALYEFESEFGAYPNDETAAALRQATGTTATLGSATANDCFYQLMAANIVMTPAIFIWEESKKSPNPIGLENCDFSYLYGMKSDGDPHRPLLVAPLINGKGIFDRKVFGGKAVILRADNSVTSLAIEQDGTVMLNGMDLFDPDQSFWGGKVPTIKWPAK